MLFVKVAEAENPEECVEIPVETEGHILMSTLSAQFPGACGLKFKTEQFAWRGVRVADDKLYPPGDDKWDSNVYHVTYPKDSKRKGEDLDINSAKSRKIERKCVDLIVLGIPWKSTEEAVRTYFETYGEVVLCEIKKDASNNSKGFGFVRYKEYDDQCSVLGKKHFIDGRWCDVKIPNSQEPETSRKIFVGRLSEALTSKDLQDYFGSYGQVIDVYIPKPFRAFGFVTFVEADIAQGLCGESHIISGVSVHVSRADPKDDDTVGLPSHQGGGPGGHHHSHHQGSYGGGGFHQQHQHQHQQQMNHHGGGGGGGHHNQHHGGGHHGGPYQQMPHHFNQGGPMGGSHHQMANGNRGGVYRDRYNNNNNNNSNNNYSNRPSSKSMGGGGGNGGMRSKKGYENSYHNQNNNTSNNGSQGASNSKSQLNDTTSSSGYESVNNNNGARQAPNQDGSIRSPSNSSSNNTMTNGQASNGSNNNNNNNGNNGDQMNAMMNMFNPMMAAFIQQLATQSQGQGQGPDGAGAQNGAAAAAAAAVAANLGGQGGQGQNQGQQWNGNGGGGNQGPPQPAQVSNARYNKQMKNDAGGGNF